MDTLSFNKNNQQIQYNHDEMNQSNNKIDEIFQETNNFLIADERFLKEGDLKQSENEHLNKPQFEIFTENQSKSDNFVNRINSIDRGSSPIEINSFQENKKNSPNNDANFSNNFRFNIDNHQKQSVINEIKIYKNKKSNEQFFKDIEDSLTAHKNNPINARSYNNSKPSIGKDVYENALREDSDQPIEFLSLFDNSNFDDVNLDILNDQYNQPIELTSSATTLVKAIKKTNAIMNEDIQLKNILQMQEKALNIERERRDIQFKIESLRNNIHALPVESNQYVNRILLELKMQQRLNEAAFNMLRQRANKQPLVTSNKDLILSSNISDRSNPYLINSLPPILNKNIYTPRDDIGLSLRAINSNDNNFETIYSTEEIRLMRLNYLQSGGHDQNILNRFTEMEYKARFKNSNRNIETLYGARTFDIDNKIKRVDYENQRLQFELQLLQDKYEILNKTPSTVSLQSKNGNQNFLPSIKDINSNEFPYSNHELKSTPRPKNISQNALRNISQISFPGIAKLKELPFTSYDPIGGFVLFIDFVTNLDPKYASARVITCLHHPKSGLGEPSVLPIVNCESYKTFGIVTSVALISTKQPVPRCPPQQALTILIELQMTIKDKTETRLKSCAWTKVGLFDIKNRLISGRWKSPLKNLPIKADTNLNGLNVLPDFGDAELFYRLVNLKDSDEQTNAPISPVYADQYNQALIQVI